MALVITAEQLRELLNYDPGTGVFTWRTRAPGRAMGAVAGSPVKTCIQLQVLGRSYRAHRLAWLHVHGEWPARNIDHIDGNPHNNAIANLRDVSQQVNLQNQRRPNSANKSSPYLGVCFNRQAKKWQAAIGVDGRVRYLGLYTTPELAHAAYVRAKRELHPGGML